MKIVRFLDYGAAKSLLELEEESSTFLLRSLKYYQGLEAARSDHVITDPDSMESRAEFEDSRTHYEFLGGVLVSCWCLTNESQPYSSQLPFRISHSEGIAVVSTVDSVAKFLEAETEYLLPGWNFRHERVRYYSEARHPKDYDVFDAMFWKRERYRAEREYRFAFVSSTRRGHLHTLVFYASNPKDYIHEIHFGPGLNSNQRTRLMGGAIALGVANTIYNFDGEVIKIQDLTNHLETSWQPQYHGELPMNDASRSCLKHVWVRLCVPSLIAIATWFLAQLWYEFSSSLSVFLSIEGTLLLAFAISFPPGPTRLKWWLCESMNYGSPPSFSYVNLYLGLGALITGITIGAIK